MDYRPKATAYRAFIPPGAVQRQLDQAVLGWDGDAQRWDSALLAWERLRVEHRAGLGGWRAQQLPEAPSPSHQSIAAHTPRFSPAAAQGCWSPPAPAHSRAGRPTRRQP